MLDEALLFLEERLVGGHEGRVLKCVKFFSFFLQKEDSSFSYEVIVVDDGSRDSTSEVI